MNAGKLDSSLKRTVVNWLFETYGGKNGIPLKSGTKSLSAACESLGIHISPGTFQNIFAGTPSALAEDTRRQLAELFRRAVPGMKPEWFDPRLLGDDPIENFKSLCLGADVDEDVLSMRVTRSDQERIDIYKNWLCGLYICYRYSFEINHDDSVSREVLRVWYDNDEGSFRFQSWYTAGGAKPGSRVDAFDGIVIPAGEMVLFAGVSNSRVRGMLWTYDAEDTIQGHFKYCRYGITVGAKAKDDRSPVAASTVYIKLEIFPEDWKWWCSEKSKIIGVDTFDNIIGGDFGNKMLNKNEAVQRTFAQWIGIFINNNPMTAMETEHQTNDRILRLNLKRFRIRMNEIRKALITNNEFVPFNSNKWKRGVVAEDTKKVAK
jgi:hypothetical protein